MKIELLKPKRTSAQEKSPEFLEESKLKIVEEELTPIPTLESKLELLYAHKKNDAVNLPQQSETDSEGKGQEKQEEIQNISSPDQAAAPKQKLRTPGDQPSTSSTNNVFNVEIVPAFFTKGQPQTQGIQIRSNNFPAFKK